MSCLGGRNGIHSAGGPFFVVMKVGPPRDPCHSLSSYRRRSFSLCGGRPLSDLLVHPGISLGVGGTRSTHCCFTSIAKMSHTFKRVLRALGRVKLSGGAIIVFTSSRNRAVYDRHASSPGGSPCSRSVGVPFLIHFPSGVRPQMSSLLLSTPSVVPAILKLYKLNSSVPTRIRKHGFTPLFFSRGTRVIHPANTLCVRGVSNRGSRGNLMGACFPSSQNVGATSCALTLCVSHGAGRLGGDLLFGSTGSPCRLGGLPLRRGGRVITRLCHRVNTVLGRVGSP